MPNDSSTDGYLVPSSPAPAEDSALEDQIQAVVSGITGLDGTLVRPRWQLTPPNQPGASTNWCAIGVTQTDGDTYAYIEHDGTGNGSSTEQRHETIELLASFYGPGAQGYASTLRDGLQIAQNREVMRSQGMALINCGPITAAPALVNQQWIRRYDMQVMIRREVERTYPVLNILSAQGTIQPQTTQDLQSEDWSASQ